MDGQHLWIRIRFSERKALEIRYSTGDRIHQRTVTPIFGSFQKGWIVIPAAFNRGLPLEDWEDMWGEEECEIDVWHPASSSWKAVTTWKTIRALLKWEMAHEKELLSKAAE